MANTNLTVDEVTNRALMVLHQKLNFIGKVNRQYDNSHQNDGAKKGESIRIKLPSEFSVTDGAVMNTQDVEQTAVTMTTGTQKHVAMNFSSKELTQDITLFSENYIEPAMSVLAANVEYDMISNVYKEVYNEVSDVGASMALADALNMSKKLTDNLAVGKRCLNLDTTANVDLVAALAGNFNPQSNLSKQFREGQVANQFAGFSEVYENTLWPVHTTGSDDGTGDHKVGAANQTGASITHGSEGAGTLLKGDIISFAGCNRVHPETKADTGELMKFVVTADMTAVATTVSISPSIVTSGAKQNVAASPTAGGAIWKRESDDSTAIGASADYRINMGFCKDAFAFATADLEMPKGVDFSSRKVKDGISLRIVRDYDINNDKLPCRVDVLYGYKTIRPQLACRGGFN